MSTARYLFSRAFVCSIRASIEQAAPACECKSVTRRTATIWNQVTVGIDPRFLLTSQKGDQAGWSPIHHRARGHAVDCVPRPVGSA